MRITDFLREDHKRVADMFARFEAGEDTSEQVAAALTKHDEIESNILYPGIERDLPELHDEVMYAREEHSEIKSGVDRVRGARAAASGGPELAAAMAELKAAVEHHVAEEEESLFVEVEAKMDPDRLDWMGEQAEG
jgi:hemerythrin-like domain-containing protein